MNQGTILGGQIGRWIVLAALVAVLGALLFLLPGGLVQAQDSTTIEYTENSTDVVLTLSAGDPEGATPITWSLPTGEDGGGVCIAITDDLDGTDGPLAIADAQDNCQFKISQSGVLEFKSPPSYESPAGGTGNGSNTYNVVVQATDGDAGPPTGTDNLSEMDTRSWFKVTVNVADVEEPGSVTLRPTDQADLTDLTSPTLQEATTVLQPQVGVLIAADDLTDPDGNAADARGVSAISAATHQWYRTTSRSVTGTPISDATDLAYLPKHLQGGASDIGQYLRVVATYTDGRGEGKTATAVSLYKTIGRIGDNQGPLVHGWHYDHQRPYARMQREART